MSTAFTRVRGLVLLLWLVGSSIAFAVHEGPEAGEQTPAAAAAPKNPDICVDAKLGRGGLMSMSLQYPPKNGADSLAFLKAVGSETGGGGSAAPTSLGDMGKALAKLMNYDLSVVPGSKAAEAAKTKGRLLSLILSWGFEGTTAKSFGVCDQGSSCTILPAPDVKSRPGLVVKGVLSDSEEECKRGNEDNFLVVNKGLPENKEANSIESAMTPKGGVNLLVPDRVDDPVYQSIQYLRKRFGSSVKLERAKDQDSSDDTSSIDGILTHVARESTGKAGPVQRVTVVSRASLGFYCYLRPGVFAHRLKVFPVPHPIPPTVLACRPDAAPSRYESFLGIGLTKEQNALRVSDQTYLGHLGWHHIVPASQCPGFNGPPTLGTGLPTECREALDYVFGKGSQ